MSRTVLIIDDHALVSTTLTMALASRGIAAHNGGGVHTVEAVLVMATGLEPGVALVDVDLGVDPQGKPVSGVDLVPGLVDLGWRVVMLTGSAREAEVAASVAAGAIGWLHKTTSFEELLAAVLAAVAGEQVFSDEERMRLVQMHISDQARKRARRSGLDQLTAREREVLDDLVAGKRAAVIAEESVVSLATVRAQIRAILAKLGVSSQLEAVALVREIES
jgi:two-component system nitrate/nitrite response regulator NarL